jgi:UDPglucose--hexose-1-phosphate uridylyltransferase
MEGSPVENYGLVMEGTNAYQGKWEKRWHPLRGEWVVYAAHRNNRPWDFDIRESMHNAPAFDPNCYLCPGNTRISGKQNPLYPDVYIFENDHPVVGLHSPSIPELEKFSHDGLYKCEKAEGIAKVVCYDPRHNVTLTDLDIPAIAKVFKALREEMIFFRDHPSIRSVLIFENKGEIVGVSNPHPHCQIYATDFVFNVVQKELIAMRKHAVETGRNIFADIILAEQKDEIRIIAENKSAIAFIPFFARFAYEVYIFPKLRHATLITMNDDELFDLADVYRTVTRKFDANFKSVFPYILAFDQAPVDDGDYNGYHIHLNICPPLRQPGLPKFLAGPETGADTFMADTMPEEKAAELRKCKV